MEAALRVGVGEEDWGAPALRQTVEGVVKALTAVLDNQPDLPGGWGTPLLHRPPGPPTRVGRWVAVCWVLRQTLCGAHTQCQGTGALGLALIQVL